MLTPKLIPHENITLILAPPSEQSMNGLNKIMETSSTKKIGMGKMITTMMQSVSFLTIQYEFLLHPNVKAIYENPQVKFDLLMLGYVLNDFQLGVAAKLQVPAVLSWVGVPFTFVDDSVGNIYDPSYVPILSNTQSTDFRWRLQNFFSWTVFKFIGLSIEYQMNRYYE